MLNLSDKDIDRLSRDAAEFYEPDNGMLSWNKLEQNLIEQIPERPPDLRFLFRTKSLIWAPAVLLLTGITFYLIKNTAHSKISTLNNQTEVNRLRQSVPGTGTGLPNNSGTAPKETTGASTAKTAPAGDAATPAPKPDAAGGKASAKAETTASSRQLVSADRANRNNPERSRAIPAEISDRTSPGYVAGGTAGAKPTHNLSAAVSSPLYSGKKTKGQASGGGNRPDLSGESLADPAGQAPGMQDAAAQRTHAVRWPMPVVSSHLPAVHGNDSALNRFAATQKAAAKPVKSLQIRRPLALGLVMGPDYTHVGGMPNDQLGNNLGISVGYYLSNRLSLNTGFQYSVKNYWTEGKFFQPQSPNNGPMAAYAFPRIESVNGSINMFEIPLTLRFDFLQREKSRLFINAGLSSYLMRKENYTFFFHNAGRAYEWDNESDDHHNYWLAVGSISAGFEQDLGKGFSFQAEPFVRMPLRGIGAGNIKLNSYGLLFSLRYSPVMGRTRK